MGLFTKKKKEKSYVSTLPQLPTLPELPGHAEFPEIPSRATPGELLNLKNDKEIHQLPSFPTNSLNEKFSQNSIKTAVGLPENTYEYADENEDENMPQMVPEKVKEPKISSSSYIESPPTIFEKEPTKGKEIIPIVKSVEPIFIQIDKFEESLKVFQSAKRKISEIEELLKDTKDIKNKEQEELTAWEDEILQLKMQIEKVDEDIFSKIE